MVARARVGALTLHKRVRGVDKLHADTLEGLSSVRDVEQVQDDWLVLAEHTTRRHHGREGVANCAQVVWRKSAKCRGRTNEREIIASSSCSGARPRTLSRCSSDEHAERSFLRGRHDYMCVGVCESVRRAASVASCRAEVFLGARPTPSPLPAPSLNLNSADTTVPF